LKTVMKNKSSLRIPARPIILPRPGGRLAAVLVLD
jgi:hypothetical protein